MRMNIIEHNNLLCELAQYKEELSRSQLKLKIQKEQMDDLLSSIDELIFVANAYNFELIYANNSIHKIYGYTAEEIMKDKNIFLNSIHPDDKKSFYKAYMKLHEIGNLEHEFRICHKDGTIKLLKAKTILKKGEGNYPDVIRGITIDITQIREAEKKLQDQLEQIKEQNEKLKEIAWIQSHKVRGPVANILGLAKLFNYQMLSDPQNMEVIQAFKASAEELDTIIAEINGKASTTLCRNNTNYSGTDLPAY